VFDVNALRVLEVDHTGCTQSSLEEASAITVLIRSLLEQSDRPGPWREALGPFTGYPTIQRISWHKTLAMVLRYAHVSGAHIDAAMTALSRTIPEPVAADQNAPETQLTQELHRRGA
jgi:hypothetical protein